MPGVVVTTQVQNGPAAPLKAPSGQAFFVGLTERGSVSTPILLRGMADVAKFLGARVSYGALYDQLQTYFSEGGQQAYVARVVGSAATLGTLALQDRNGTPAPTLTVNASSPGSWSTQVQVQVLDGSVANTFRIKVYLNGVVVEDRNNLLNPADAVQQFNASVYIRLTDLGSASTAPANNPAVLTATPLSAGNDDRASVTDAVLVTGLALFTPDLGDGSVAIPSHNGATIWAGIQAHCIANNRLGILAGAQGDTKATLLGYPASLNSEYVGIFAPYVKIPNGNNGTFTISPEGYVMACRARAHSQIGPWTVPAGSIAAATYVVDVDQKFTQSDANDLDDGQVNIIRVVAGSPRLYGWKSLSDDTVDYKYLKDRDLLNNITVNANAVLENYVFRTIDRKGQLQSEVNAALVGLVDPIQMAGGLYPLFNVDGQQLDPGYKVETGSTVNTPDSLASNVLNARLSLRISPTSAMINLTIVKVGLQAGM